MECSEPPSQTRKNSKRDENTAPVETMVFFRIAAREKNRKNDQHRHGADVDEHQSKSYEFCAEQEKEGCEPEQRQHQAEGGVHEIRQRRGRQRPASVKTEIRTNAAPFI